MSDANEPDPVSDANEPDPVSDANEPQLRVRVTRGGDPGDVVLAAVAAILTRPVIRAPSQLDEDEDEPVRTISRWRRAARLEAVVHGRRIASISELARHV